MLVSNRIVRVLLDGAEMHGVDRQQLLRVLGPDAEHLLESGERLEWGSVVAIFEELSRQVGGNAKTLEAIGRDMRLSRSPDLLRNVAAGVLSARGMYRWLDRWIAPAYPHLRFFIRFSNRHRLYMHGEIPEPHATSSALFEVFAARLVYLPEMLGLPPARVIEKRISERTADLVIELPEDPSWRARVRRAAHALVVRRRSVAAREEQRASLTRSIEALQRARDELRVLLDRLPDPVVVHRQGEIVWANQAFVRALDFESLEQLTSTHLVDLVAPPFRALIESRPGPGRTEREPRMPPPLTEVCFVARGGAEVRLELTPPQGVVFDGLPSLLIVGRDVTERVRMQQRLMATDRLASVGLLAAGVAHEVNNPLGYVLNNIEIARKIAGVPAEAEASRAVLDLALEGVARIRSIVRDLLMLARGSDAGGEVVDLRPVIDSTLALAAREIERHAHLETRLGPAPPVPASGPRVAQVLLNLVSNALDAMQNRPRDESILRVTTSRADDGGFLLEVSDTGRGIPPAELQRVFEPFFTTKGVGEGTGLGLSIAQRIVVDMGGEISVASEEGRGTTFRVLIPPAKELP
jgi:signal transduction histidine kinase